MKNQRIYGKVIFATIALLLSLAVVNQTFASGSRNRVQSSAAAPLAAQANNPTAVVATGALNVRSGPGIGFDIVTTSYQGHVVQMLGRHASSNWIKVRTFSGLEGWLHSAYIQPSVPISTLPVVPGPQLPTPTAVVATGALNVRTGPGIQYGVVTASQQGHVVQMLGRNANGSWVKVRVFSGQEGWVNASLIQPNVAISSLPVADSPTTLPSAPVVSTTGALNVRSGPGTNYGVVATISQQQRITLLGRNNNTTWIKVRLANGQEGWISATPLVQANVVLTNLPVLGTAAATATPSSVVNTGILNVRSGPGINYGVVTTVSQGQSVTLLGRNSAASWVRIQLNNGQQGWVNASLIQTSVSINGLPVVGEPTQPTSNPTAVVTTGRLNVRSGPDVGFSVVTVSEQGHVVQLLGRNANATWAKVRVFSGQEGWVNASLIQPSVAISTLPVVDSPGLTPSAIVTSGAANVRAGPGTEYGIVTVSYQGHALDLLGRNANASWVRVRTFSGQEGWVNATLIQANVALSTLPVVSGTGFTAVAEVTADSANVYAGPGTQYSVITVSQQGHIVHLLGRNADASWVRVRVFSGQEGWMNPSLIQANVALGSLPVVQ